MTILIFIVTATILTSASCSLFESILYSTRMGTLESAKTKEKKGRTARLFIGMKTNISETIAAILILNTLANTGGAAIAGMYAVDFLGTAWLPVFSAIFTIAILFLSEIYPKTVGAVHWRGLWPFIVYPLKVIIFALYPFIFITQKATASVMAKQKGKTITEDEILALVHLGAREGEISKEESAMVRNIINLEDKTVEQIMTPRKMVFSIDGAMNLADATLAILGKGFSRIPVYEKDKENIIGYVTIHDLHKPGVAENIQDSIKSIMRPISQVALNSNCLTLLTSFLKQRMHIAIVADEYGGVDGLVTLEDLIETVLGREIVDETDKVVDLQEEARKKPVSKTK